MDELARVAIVGFAAWRLASLLVSEDGPWGLSTRLRRFVGAEVEIDLDAPAADIPEPRFFGKLFGCIWCISPYITVSLWALWEVHWYIPGVVAAAAIVLVTERWATR